MDNKKKRVPKNSTQNIMDLDGVSESEEEDDDYVPDKKVAEATEKEIAKQNNGGIAPVVETKEMGGIQALREKKRQQETDDLWDLMNEEDDFDKKMKLKRQKIA